MNVRARVFISCGQSQRTDELATANAIATRLRELGFEPYVAVMEQSLRGLRENIFAQLESSEYFIFVDFKREQLDGGPDHRGSLFSHQELALASYLDLPVLAFQERGVRRLDGVAGFLQANATEFTDRHLLANAVADLVRQKNWDPTWQNGLLLERDPEEYDDAGVTSGGIVTLHGRFFHIRVRNLHRQTAARNCYVYLEGIYDIAHGRALDVETVEMKWAGYILPNAVIAPTSSRHFDAFWLDLERPNNLRFNVFADSSRYMPQVSAPGHYRIAFAVMSQNFRTTRAAFEVTLDGSVEGTRFTPASVPAVNSPGHG